MKQYFKKLLIVAIIFCLLGQNLAEDNPNGLVDRVKVTKVETRNSIENNKAYGSEKGGTTLYITAEGFSKDITANVVQVGNYDCKIPEKGILQNLIMCVTEEAWEMENRWSQEVVLWVEDKERSVSKCPGGCYFHYTSSSTPIINYVQPNANTPGSVAQWDGIWRVDSTADITKLSIGEYNCNRYDLFSDLVNLNDDVEISSSSRTTLKCDIAPTQPAGLYKTNAEIVPGSPAYLSQGLYLTADGSKTYNMAIVAEVKTVSQQTGGKNGNRLTIDGNGFGSDLSQVNVSVGDLNCEIVQISNEKIICDLEAGETATFDPAVSGQFLGGQGAQYTRFDGSCAGIWNVEDFAAGVDGISGTCIQEDRILSSWENVYNDETDGASQLYRARGYFKAPRSGTYHLWVAADDSVQVYFNTNAQTMERGDLVLHRTSYTSNRIYWYPNDESYKAQIGTDLVEGEYYWVELYSYNGGSTGHFSLSIETPEPTGSDIWSNTVPEIQKLKITPVKDNQRWSLKVFNQPGEVSFYFKYTDPSTMRVTFHKTTSSKTIANWTPESIVSNLDRAANYYGAVLVESYELNEFGVREEGATSGYEIIFDFELYRPAGAYNQSPKCSVSSNCSFQKIQEQSDPVSGTFQLQFNGDFIEVWNSGAWTKNIPYNKYGGDLESGFERLYDNYDMEITRTGRPVDGVEFVFVFRGFQGDLPQLQIISNDLEGGKATPQIQISTMQQGNNRPFYEPIPFDMSFVAADTPAVQVQVNGILSVCSGDCSYVTDAILTPSFATFSETANNLTIDLSSAITGSESVNIWYAGYECKNIDLTTSSAVTCTVDGIEAGENFPIVLVDGLGYAEYTGTTTSTPLVVSSLSLSTGSVQGGVQITITGTGFPQNLENLSVQFGTSVAKVISTSNTQIVVLLPAAPGSADGAQSVVVNYNGLSSNTDVQFTYSSAGIPTVTSISPLNASPVQKGTLTITGTNFGTDDSIVSVFLLDNEDNIVYELNVLTVIDTQITARLGGGKVGTYYLRVIIDGIGYSIGNAEFKYIIEISTVSPQTGNQNGGTVITISGINFSSTIADNAVILNNGGTDLECEVIAATNTELQVRTPANALTAGSIFDIIVQGRLIEESVCANGSDCTFTYTSTGMPTLDPITSAKYDNKQVVTLTGTNFSTTEDVYIFIDGVIYENIATVSSATQASFTVPDSLKAGNHVFTLSFNGVGHAGTWEAKLDYNIDTGFPKKFSTGGALLTIQGSGFDVNSIIMIGTKQCTIISASITEFTCSAPAQPAGGYPLIIKRSYYDDLKYWTDMTYTLEKTGKVTSSTSSSTLQGSSTYNYQFVGTFISSTLSAELELVSDTTVRIQGTLTAADNFQFTNVPVGVYNIRITDGGNGYAAFADGVVSQITVSFNSVSISAGSTTGLNGGKTLTLTSAAGFNSHNQNKNEVYVCGQRCDIESVSDTNLSCTLPKVNTEYLDSVQPQDDLIPDQILYQAVNYNNIQDPINFFTKVTSTKSPVNNLNYQLALAYDNFEEGQDSCYYKWEVMTGSKLKLNYLQILVDEANLDLSTLYYLLELEGSNDDLTWTTIETFEPHTYTGYREIKMGVNSDPENNPVTQYKYLRLTENKGTKRTNTVCNYHFRVVGHLYYQNTVTTATDLSCGVNLRVNGVSQVLGSQVTYAVAQTSYVDGISPKYGKIQGGESVTVTGSGFGTDSNAVSVKFDGVECTITSIINTSITCNTGVKSGVADPEIAVYVNSNKSVVKAGVFFIYGLLWSDEDTWNGESSPREGDSVQVPAGQVLILDESTPRIFTLIIQGGFYVADDVGALSLDANYVVIRMGWWKIGHYNNPHTSELTVTLHGNKEDQQLPMFGNKCLVCHNCQFDVHGSHITPTFSQLTTTAAVGATQITVKDAGNWQVGHQIGIATTSYYGYHSEKAIITAISGNTLTLDRELEFEHIGVSETYGTYTLDMYAEVVNLSRNVLIQGDENSEVNQYGGHIMIHGSQDKGARARITYTELTQMGQPSIMGRYNIHFHQFGIASNSFIIGNAIHESNARMVAIHATDYLRVAHNVGYHNRGHNIFLEDGVETHNVIEYNCIIHPYSATNMLQTDITVAGIWVTNPSNYVRYNHVAGSEFYGIWAEIKEEPESRVDMCPQGMKMLQIDHNIGHSNIRFGLRFFHLYSRTYPCQSTKNLTNPLMFDDNPSIPQVYTNQTSWKNGESGILAEFMGNTIFQDCIMADSFRAGFQSHVANFTAENLVLQDSLIVGATAANGEQIPSYPASAIIMPRTNGFLAKNVKIYNMVAGTHIIESSSENDQVLLWVQGGYQTDVENLEIVNSNSANKLKWKGPLRNMVFDRDGSLTNTNVPTWISPYYPHFDQLITDNECQMLDATLWDNSVGCSTMLRGYKFGDFDNLDYFIGQTLKVFNVNDGARTWGDETLTDADFGLLGSSKIKNKPNKDMLNGYAALLPTGHVWNLHWNDGADFDRLAIYTSFIADDADQTTIFRFNYTENREIFEVYERFGGANSWNQAYTQQTDLTLFIKPDGKANSDVGGCDNGDFYHDIDNQFLYVCINNKGKTSNFQQIDVHGIYCRDTCESAGFSCEKESTVRYWHNTDPAVQAAQYISTETGKAMVREPGTVEWIYSEPVSGWDFKIPCEWTVYFNIDNFEFNNLYIDGTLRIDPSIEETTITATNIWVTGGKLVAGNAGTVNAYKKKLNIVLKGTKSSTELLIDDISDAGTKGLVVTGALELYGTYPANTQTRLAQIANAGDSIIYVVNDISDWLVGDELVLGANNIDGTGYEKVEIQSLNASTKQITLTAPLKFWHYGNAHITVGHSANAENQIDSSMTELDMRTPVGHLSRNIKIYGTDEDAWGGHIQIYHYINFEEEVEINVRGHAILQGVQMTNLGQHMRKAGLEILYTNREYTEDIITTVISGSSMADSYGIMIDGNNANYVVIDNNVLYRGEQFLIQALDVAQWTITDNLLIGAYQLLGDVEQGMVWTPTAFIYMYQPYTPSVENHLVYGNVGSGSEGIGFTFPGTPCEESDDVRFYDNESGYANKNGMLYNMNENKCYVAGYIATYGSKEGITINEGRSDYGNQIHKITAVENQKNIELHGASTHTFYVASLTDTFVAPIVRHGCTECYDSTRVSFNTYCSGTTGIQLDVVTENGETMPWYKDPSIYDVICVAPIPFSSSVIQDTTGRNYKATYADKPLCKNNYMFKNHPTAADATSGAYLSDVSCDDCDFGSIIHIMDPSPSWEGWFGGCGNFVCTGIENVLVQDLTGTLFGGVKTVISKNQYIAKSQSFITEFCQLQTSWNAYLCTNNDFALLQWDAIGTDKQKQSPIPVYLKNDLYSNTLNMWREWEWQGSEPLNLRLNRFLGLTQINAWSNITYTGTQSVDIIYKLGNRLAEAEPDRFVILQNQYFRSLAIEVSVNSNIVRSNSVHSPANLWDQTGNCGANNYYYKNNTIQFVVVNDPDCVVEIKQLNQVYINLRVKMTLANFLDGQYNFEDKVSAYLGISYDKVRVVGIMDSAKRILASSADNSFEIKLSVRAGVPGDKTNSYDAKKEYLSLKGQAEALKAGIEANDLELKELLISEFSSYQVNVLKESGEESYISESDFANEDDENSEDKSKSKVIGIALGIVFGLAFIIIILIVVYHLYKKKQALVVQNLKIAPAKQTQGYDQTLQQSNKLSMQQSESRNHSEMFGSINSIRD